MRAIVEQGAAVRQTHELRAAHSTAVIAQAEAEGVLHQRKKESIEARVTLERAIRDLVTERSLPTSDGTTCPEGHRGELGEPGLRADP